MKQEDYDELLRKYGKEYANETNLDSLEYMENLDMFFKNPYDAVKSAFHGGRYGFEQDKFNPNDDYFRFDGKNIQSVPYVNDYLHDVIDEDDFIQWCKDNGYLDVK